MLKCILLAVAIVIGSFATAEGQTYFHIGVPGPQTTVGWNFGNLSHCSVFFDGSNTWFFAFAEGGGYGQTNNPAIAAILAPGCQTGNRFAVHVLSLNPFRWDFVVLYPFK